MSEFIANVRAELDTSQAEAKLKALEKDRKIKISLELDKSAEMQARDIARSIEKGLRSTRIDTSGFAKQLTDGFNISDKNVMNNLKRQIDSMLTGLSKTWDGKVRIHNLNFGRTSPLVEKVFLKTYPACATHCCCMSFKVSGSAPCSLRN